MSNARRATLGLTPLALFLFAGVAAAQVPSPPPGVQWAQSVDFALQSARESGAPILAFVTSDHCGYCRKMERETWSDPEVAKAVAAGYVPLRLDAERDAELVSQMGVKAFPTTIVFAPDGRALDAAVGYVEAEKLAKLLRTPHPLPPAAAMAPRPPAR